MICWNIRNYSPVHMASHSRRMESSATSLWKAWILQCQYKYGWGFYWHATLPFRVLLYLSD